MYRVASATGNHAYVGPPLRTDVSRQKTNSLAHTFVDVGRRDLRSPILPAEDGVKSPGHTLSGLRTLLDGHVELAPDHVDEELDSASAHQIGE